MNVKNKKRGRPEKSANSLSALVILNQAKVMLQRDGKVPSIRQLATELGVDAMAIYHYFANKQTLLEALVISLVEEVPAVDSAEPWQVQLTTLCQGYVELLVRHPGLLEIMLRMDNPEGPAKVFTERYQHIVAELGLSERRFTHSLDLLADYLHGFALAYSCQPSVHDADKPKLELNHLEGPLGLICLSLTVSEVAR